MLSTLLIVSTLFVGQADPALAQAPDPALQANVRRLLRQLGDEQLAVRDQAEMDLIALGPHVLELLPRSDTGLSNEVKERLNTVRGELQKQAVESSIQASAVSLSGEMTLAEAAAELERQTGNKLIGVEGREATIKLDAKDSTFWPVLDQVLDQAGLDIHPYGGFADRLVLSARPESQSTRFGAAYYSGIFRFEPISIEANRYLRNPQVSGLSLNLGIAWEPRTKPISLTQPSDKLTAVDENGVEIPVDNRAGERTAWVNDKSTSVVLPLQFALPDRGARKIASLKGELTALVPGSIETFEFESLTMGENVEQRRAEVTVIFEGARKNGDTDEIQLRVRFDEAADALESYRNWIYTNETYLVDREGKQATPLSQEGGRGENEVVMKFLYVLDKPLDNYKLVYRTPAAILQKPIKYELKDVPLP